MAWATTTEVQAKTGVTVDQATLDLAQSIIEVFADVDPDITTDDDITARDKYRLKMAVVFQAAWQDTQTDLIARTDVSQLGQEGVSFTYANPDASQLAPLAKRSLDRLSWNRSRAIGPRRKGFGSLDEWELAYLKDETDGGALWQPLSGGSL